jgi:tetratricopeptide (TPR) repeat protein
MQRLLRIALLAGVLLATPAALAQVEIGTIGKPPKSLYYWRDDKGEIRFSLKRFQGRVMVFYFWRTSNAESVDQFKLMLAMDKKLRSKGVRFVGMCTDAQEQVDKFMTDKNLESFPGAGEIYNMRGDFLRLVQTAFGSMSHPECVIVDPFSNIVWRGHPNDQLEQRILDVVENTRPIAGDPKQIEARLRKAEKLIDEKEYGKAYTIARQLFLATNEESPENNKARSLMEKVEQKGADFLKEARDALATNKERAAYIVAQLSVRLEDQDKELKRAKEGAGRDQQPQQAQEQQTGLIRDVSNALGEMYADRKMKDLIRKAMDNASGELLNEQAADLEEIGHYDDARVLYKQVLEKYKETAAAKTAETMLEKVRTDKKVAQSLDKSRGADEARRWLDIGERYAKAELYDLAREMYEKVIKEHAKTDYAKTAKERLDKLPKATAKADSDKPGAKSDDGKAAKKTP